eukprot:8060961-Prorocentrum_lima.AAC.1
MECNGTAASNACRRRQDNNDRSKDGVKRNGLRNGPSGIILSEMGKWLSLIHISEPTRLDVI